MAMGRPKKIIRLLDVIKTKAWFASCKKDLNNMTASSIATKSGVSPRMCQYYQHGAKIPQWNMAVQSISNACNNPIGVKDAWLIGIEAVPLWCSFEGKADIVKWVQEDLNVSPEFFFGDKPDPKIYLSDYFIKLIGYTQVLRQQPDVMRNKYSQDKMRLASMSLAILYVLIPADATGFFNEKMTLKEIKFSKINMLRDSIKDAAVVLQKYNLNSKEIMDCVFQEMKRINKIDL